MRSRLPYFFLAVLLIYIAICFAGQINRLWTMQASLQEVEQQVIYVREKNSVLWDRLTVLESEGYIEDAARERLGLIKPGETRIVTVFPERDEPAIDTSITD
jgi:cell division protein FtsB